MVFPDQAQEGASRGGPLSASRSIQASGKEAIQSVPIRLAKLSPVSASPGVITQSAP